MRFKWKISLILTAVITVILLLTQSFVLVRFEQAGIRGEEDLLKAHLNQLAAEFRKNTRSAVSNWAGDIDRNQYIAIRDSNGRIIFEKGIRFPEEWLKVPEEGFPEEKLGQYDVNGQHIIYMHKVLKSPSSGQKVYSIWLYENTAKVDKFVQQGRVLIVIGTVGGILLAAICSYFAAGALIRPVTSITRRAQAIDADDLNRRLPLPRSKDELYELTSTLNSMLERISGSFEKQQQFIADASHELRTPLTIIEGHAQMMKRWGLERPEIAAESIDYILQETGRLKRLTEQLLQNASLEQSKEEEQPETAVSDWTEIADIWGRQAAFLNPRVHFELALPNDPVWVAVPAEELKQLVLNIVDNAVKYTPDGGTVRMELSVDNGLRTANLSVSDTGIGIPEEELPHIFERFYRTDKSRSREKGGSGLGLAIVKKIIDKYGGAVRLESSTGAGTTVLLQFPLTEDGGNVTQSS